jgi:hypothetical protein
LDEGELVSVIGSLFRPSGGGSYHWRGLRRRSLWQPFCKSLAIWLKRWNPPREGLILIGPSGGYTLPNEWLRSFGEVHAFDLDPLAPWFFRRRHGLYAHFERRDVFWRTSPNGNRELSLEPLREILAKHPGCTVLFCNVLGQVPLEGSLTEGQWHRYLSELRQELAGRSWASYHDIFSLRPIPLAQHAEATQMLAAEISPTGLPGVLKALPVAHEIQAIDHLLLSNWTDGLAKIRLGWSLTPQSLHIIECVTEN